MKYMVSVEGSQAPVIKHATLNSAKMEAERLALQTKNQGRIIHVVQLVCTLKPVQSHQWVEEKPIEKESTWESPVWRVNS
jgi:hypothetical protein